MFVSNSNIFRQSKAFYLVTSFELWQRFSYYGLQGILALYLVQKIGLSESDAFSLFTIYCGLSFGFIAMGNWLSQYIINSKNMVLLGTFVLMVGHVLLVFSQDNLDLIYLGLAVISVGHGLFKTMPELLLPDSYSNTRFTLYHMLACIGTISALILAPYIAHTIDWNATFSLGVFGIFMIIINFIFYHGWAENEYSRPKNNPTSIGKNLLVLGSILLLIALSYLFLHYRELAYWVLNITVLIAIAFFIKEIKQQTGAAFKKMIVAFLLLLELFIFFTLYIQIPTSINFFAIHHVTPQFLGLSFYPEQFQSLSPIWILLGAPFLAILYQRAGNRLPVPHKLAIGMVLCAGAFLVLPWGAAFADDKGMISANWLILNYALHSIGHLTISALGLIVVVKLVPSHFKNFMIAIWYLTMTAAAISAGKIAAIAVTHHSSIGPLPSLAAYSEMFMKLGIVTALTAVLMVISAPIIHRMMKD